MKVKICGLTTAEQVGDFKKQVASNITMSIDDEQPKVFIIKTTSRSKSSLLPKVSNHEKSDGAHHFPRGPREHLH